LSNGWLGQPPQHADEKAFKTLVKAGCGQDEIHLIVSHISKDSKNGDDWAKKLYDIAAFAKTIGIPAAKDYFRAIGETKAVAELTDERVFNFAKSIDPHTAEWYFWTIWGTKAVAELTADRVLKSAEFFKAIDGLATVEYFLAIRETKAAAELTDEKVLNFAKSIGSDAAVDYFGAFWETRAVAKLTEERILDFARSIGSDAAREYFRAIRETKAVEELTSERVLTFAKTIGNIAAEDCFRAIRKTKAVAELTSDNVFVFAESIGRNAAKEYFRVIESTKAVAQLTAESVLDTAGVVRAIGSDAAVDYFLAIGESKVEDSSAGMAKDASSPTHEATVQILSTLDIPTYNGHRVLGLLGLSAFFWFYVFQYAGLGIGVSRGLLDLAIVAGVWACMLYIANFLLGTIAQRSIEQFVQRRRRLLNEHGIPWHDCLAGDKQCRYCWSTGHSHADDRYDYGRFCRCLACRTAPS
jgi:hypothetical protein